MVLKAWLVLLKGIGLTIFIFGLLVWAYVVIVQVTHPEWLPATLSHHAFPPLNWRVDDLGIVGFAIAPIGFLTWYLSRFYLSTSEHRGK
jgi:hypothetical protein